METQNSPEQMKFRADLTKKINKIGVEIGKLKADGANTFSNYKYVSAEQMNAEIREKGEEFGVCIIPSIVESSEQSFSTTETDAKGVSKTKVTIRTNVKMSIDVIDTESGYCMKYNFTGSDQDTGGKSEQQAITQCFKYFLFKLFKISTKDEQDGDGKTTEVTPPRTQQSTPPKTQQQSTATKTTQQNKKDTPPEASKIKMTENILQKVVEKVRNEGHSVWEKNKGLYEYTKEQEDKIKATKVIMTQTKIEVLLAAIASGKKSLDVWEKNKGLYEYTKEQDDFITSNIAEIAKVPPIA